MALAGDDLLGLGESYCPFTPRGSSPASRSRLFTMALGSYKFLGSQGGRWWLIVWLHGAFSADYGTVVSARS